jgi:hypothetical protein
MPVSVRIGVEEQRGGDHMRIRSNWTANGRAEVDALCQRNRELLLRMEFMLGVDRPIESLSTSDCLRIVGLQIEQMNRDIDELELTLRSDRRQTEKRGGHHDGQ